MSVKGLDQTEHKSFGDPDETREFPRSGAEILLIGDSQIGRMTFEPGDFTSPRSGHDAGVLGEEPAVFVDWYGAGNHAKASS